MYWAVTCTADAVYLPGLREITNNMNTDVRNALAPKPYKKHSNTIFIEINYESNGFFKVPKIQQYKTSQEDIMKSYNNRKKSINASLWSISRRYNRRKNRQLLKQAAKEVELP